MITVYTFEDERGREQGFMTQDWVEAKAYALEYQLLVIANEYEFSDSEPVLDARPHTAEGDDNDDD